MSRHSVQIKALLQTKRLIQTTSNPVLSLKSFPQPLPQVGNLKRCSSSSSLRKKQRCEMVLIEQKYRKLEQNCRTILEQTRNKALLFAKRKSELVKHQVQSQKNKKQIQRLRAMIGFGKKEDFSVQIQMSIQPRSSYEEDFSKISTCSKAEKSTDPGLTQTVDNWNVKQKKPSGCKESRKKTPYKLMCNKSQTTICFGAVKQGNVKSTLSKYKFVPTLAFN